MGNCQKILQFFWTRHPDTQQTLSSWYDEVVGKNRVVINIADNKYRLIVAIAYQFGAIYIKFVGIHQEYDKVDVL